MYGEKGERKDERKKEREKEMRELMKERMERVSKIGIESTPSPPLKYWSQGH